MVRGHTAFPRLAAALAVLTTSVALAACGTAGTPAADTVDAPPLTVPGSNLAALPASTATTPTTPTTPTTSTPAVASSSVTPSSTPSSSSVTPTTGGAATGGSTG